MTFSSEHTSILLPGISEKIDIQNVISGNILPYHGIFDTSVCSVFPLF